MPPKFIRFDQGLRTSAAKVMLEEGELSQADDSYYKVGDPGIWSVLGRTAFNSAAESGSIKGARYLEFEGATDVIVDHVGGAYRQATSATTGAFANLFTGLTGGPTLDSTHYNNQHFLMNGVDRNQVVSSDLSVIYHGMLTNVAAPTLFRDSGALAGFTLTSAKTITYWVEERVKDGSGTILKRNAASLATCVTLTGDGTNDKPVITRPTLLNPDVTDWALFATATNGAFPNGAEIAEVSAATTSIEDTRTGTDPGLPTGSTYETVTIEVAGVTQNYPKNGPPTIASTGDVFEDSIVINDASDPSHIVYSMQDDPHAFPAINLIKFETKEADEVKCIRRLGDTLLILLRDSVWRISTLPRPDDSSFETERIKAQVHGAQGCVGPMAADAYTVPDGPRLAYVSRYGILSTNGFSWETLSDDLDWESTVNVSALDKSVLLYDPRHYILLFYYPNVGSVVNNRALYFHVHPSQLKTSGKPKITGPITVAANCATTAKVNGVDEIFTGQSDGKLYREWTGTVDEAGQGINFAIASGDVYPQGIGTLSEIRRLWIHHRATPGVSVTGSLTRLLAGVSQNTISGPFIDLTREEASHFYKQANTEGIRVGAAVTNPSAPVCLNMCVLDVRVTEETRL